MDSVKRGYEMRMGRRFLLNIFGAWTLRLGVPLSFPVGEAAAQGLGFDFFGLISRVVGLTNLGFRGLNLLNGDGGLVKIKNLSEQILVQSEEIARAIQSMDVVIDEAVREAFFENEMRNLWAEFDDFMILTARGGEHWHNAAFEEKVKRLELLGRNIYKSGVFVFPQYMVCKSISYYIYDMIQIDRMYKVSCIREIVDDINIWLETDSCNLLTRYNDMFRKKSLHILAQKYSIKYYCVGWAAFKKRNYYELSKLYLRVSSDESSKVIVSPVVHEGVVVLSDIDSFPEHWKFISSSEDGDILYSDLDFDEWMLQYIVPISSGTKIGSFVVGNTDADESVRRWINSVFGQSIQIAIDSFVSDYTKNEDLFRDLEKFLIGIEEVRHSLIQKALALDSSFSINEKKYSRNLPV